MNQFLTAQNGMRSLVPIIALAFGIAYEYLFADKALGLNYPLFIGLVLTSLLFLFPERIGGRGRRFSFLFVSCLLFALLVFVRASDLLTALNVLASLGLLALCIEAVAGAEIRRYTLVNYLAILFLPFKGLPYFFSGLGSYVTLGAKSEQPSDLARVLKGVAIAFPIIVLITILFSSADLVFKKYITAVFSFDFSIEVMRHLLRATIVASIAFAAITYISKWAAKQLPTERNKTSEQVFGIIEASILLGSVATVFFVFIAIQFTYLFGGEQAIVVQGFAYADYARKGFFELIAVALISFGLLLAVARFVVRNGEQHRSVFKWLAGILILETILIMVSAFERLSLYEFAYGFTTLRLYSHIFILWVGSAFALLGYEILVKEDRSIFAFRILASMVFFLLAVNGLNPDRFIARENINRYHTTGEIDWYYLASLSDDASSEIFGFTDDIERQGFKSPPESYSAIAVFPSVGYDDLLSQLRQRQIYEAEPYYTHWPSLHLARSAVQKLPEQGRDHIQNP